MSASFWLWLAVVAIAVGGAVFYFMPQAIVGVNYTNYPSSGTDIIAFGDSLVAGYGSSDNGGFVSVLSKNINQEIVNLGVDGNTTGQALARINQFDQYKPKVVILLVGGNDYLHRLSMDTAFINLENIILNLQKRGAVVVVVGVRLNPVLGNFDKQYEQLVKKYNVAYVPNALDGILSDPKLMSDGVHPNDAGYKILASRILPVLWSVLQ